MYLAPLNYDRFFKKVFSDKAISKRFLEDFFDTTIEEIELLPTQHKISDDAAVVEFDYRCKIGGKYVIIDMQQWYKPDIVKRFYVYHCVNTAVQLENMPLKAITTTEQEQQGNKDYRSLEEVVTLIWLADDTLNVDHDYLAYAMTPELLTEFVKKEDLWASKDMQRLMEERERLLSLLDNRTKQLDFLPKNRLIFALQHNIVRNKKYKPYHSWFRLAEKSRNLNNTAADFEEFAKDKVLSEVMRRLDKSALKPDDVQYITDFRQFAEQFKLWEDGIKKDAELEGEIRGIERGIEKGIEIGKGQGVEENQISTAKVSLLEGLSVELTAKITGLSIEKVREIARDLNL